MLIVVLLTGNNYASWPPMLWFTLLVAAESTAVIAVCVSRRTLPRPVITLDVAWLCAALFAGAALAQSASSRGWVDYMYTYSLISCLALGFAYRRYLTVFAATSAIAVSFVLSDWLIQHSALINVLPDVLSYFTNTAVGWAVARYLRRLAREIDTSREDALSHAETLARERERTRHARILHDRVLQTLETLSRGDWVSDREFRAHIAGEAAWLRGLIAGVDTEDPSDLLVGLQRVVSQKARTGLQVDFNSSQLRESDKWRPRLPAPSAAALVEAAQEALTNVAKHAGVTMATMQVSIADQTLTVSVLDQGRGFDPTATHQGIGLGQSICSRMADVGGRATVDSSPGGGTYVELSVPLPRDPVPDSP
jgi:signal transduction histidine kinase